MTTTLDLERTAAEQPAPLDPKRFRALVVIAIAQLMVVLDSAVVIIALPSAQRSLHISTANRQWMLTAYTLSFAGLLLLGGRHRGLPGSQAHVHHQPDRLCGRLGLGRSGRELGHAVRRPRPAGGLCGDHGAGGAVAAHRGLHRAQGAGPGLRRLRRDRRRGRGHRPHPGRRADPVRLMALDAADQRPHRHRRRHHRRPASSPRAGARHATATTSPVRSP